MKKRIFSLVLVSAMVLGALTACGGSKKETKAETTATETTAAADESSASAGDKILHVASEDPQVPLDMQLNTYSIIMKITDNVTESLLLTNPEGELEPTLLAEMPTLSDDKLTYSFTLKEGVTFHNGAPLTSNDVKYSLERMVKKLKMASLLEKVEGYQDLFDGKADELSGIVVIDDTHFEIHMAEVYTPLLSALSTPYCAIYPAEACEAAGDNWGMTELYGTGPFKLVSYQTGVGVELAKNENYHGGEVKLDGIDYTFIDDPNTGVLEYQKGNVDVVYMDSALYPTYANGELKDELYSFNPVGGYYLAFNVNDIPEVEVRQAMAYAIDRNALCDSVLFGTASPNSNFLQEGLIGARDDMEQFEYNPEKAKELLAKAGYADGYDLRITVNTKYPTSVKIATAVQAQMKEAGINVEVEQVDSAAWTDMKKSGGVTCGIGNWYVDYNDPDSMLYPVSDGRVDLNSIFWHNDEFKQLMLDGVETDDAAERQEIYARADEILTHEEFPVTMLYNETLFYLKKPYVKGFEVTFTYRTMFKDADIEK
ncbi:ABC transporter substrate-binding protein [Frisingicoccus sp.]|uniref:ABC transporter substrate-binding protein n=1 Tax=Frisingicoccus sp. TaxID=1918627 RepID=UPI00263490D7|nr:ABC transporter substrate-binding protein [Frisingicoccus sp.]MDD6231969.1 ABC transporter substrate-binding protein [Frisingicoccus sp.]MDY4834932.1 ABC transporter substrate-binding protein [Frisingicoccus sp.]MDY4922087.1 ABC transporter substrate-binding protein [Frisingicoccus sp.]